MLPEPMLVARFQSVCPLLSFPLSLYHRSPSLSLLSSPLDFTMDTGTWYSQTNFTTIYIIIYLAIAYFLFYNTICVSSIVGLGMKVPSFTVTI